MSWNFDQDIKEMNSLLEETAKGFISEEEEEEAKYSKWSKMSDEEKEKLKSKLFSMSGQFADNLKAFLEDEGKLSDEQIDAIKELGESVNFSKDCLNEEVSQVNNALALIEGFDSEEELTEKSRMQDIADLKDKYEGEWIDAKVTESKPSAHGKGYDITVKITDKKAKDLPPIIETEMVSKEVKKGDRVKVQLYISAGGVLVDKIK